MRFCLCVCVRACVCVCMCMCVCVCVCLCVCLCHFACESLCQLVYACARATEFLCSIIACMCVYMYVDKTYICLFTYDRRRAAPICVSAYVCKSARKYTHIHTNKHKNTNLAHICKYALKKFLHDFPAKILSQYT